MLRTRWPAIVVAAVIFSGCRTDTATPGPTTASLVPQATSTESAPATSTASAWAIDDAVQASADPGLVASLAALPAPSGGARYAATGIRETGDWAMVAIADADPQAASDSGFAIAVRTGGQWTVVLATDTKAFCAALAKAPPGALTQDERDYFMGCN